MIGAGAAGLVCARELDRHGHEVTVFEQSDRVGGVWCYASDTEDDLLGISPSVAVFSSLYTSLRTNLPRDLMAFMDYTFDSNGGGDDFWQRYPHHSKVLQYLQNFATDFQLRPMIRFQQIVTRLEKQDNHRWQITTGRGQSEQFDAVAVCNGHYSKPKFPEIAGIENFKGLVMHSHNYRNPDNLTGKRVVLLGTAASGADISRELAKTAEQVYWCGEIFSFPAQVTSAGVNLFPPPLGFTENGILEFPGKVIVRDVDVFMFCTGYEYEFPFLPDNVVNVTDNWVNPLYLDMLAPAHANLAFIGLPYLVIPFPLFEMQAKWFAKTLAGDVSVPTEGVMFEESKRNQKSLQRRFTKQRHFHKLGELQTDYVNDLAQRCGEPPLPAWFGKLALEAQRSRLADPEHFRDKPMMFHGPTTVKNTSR